MCVTLAIYWAPGGLGLVLGTEVTGKKEDTVPAKGEIGLTASAFLTYLQDNNSLPGTEMNYP